MQDFFKEDDISVEKAKEKAERLSFAPMMFQAAVALKRLGILRKIADSRKQGISSQDIASGLGVAQYGVETLLEAGLSLDLVKLVEPYKYRLGKTGYFWLLDKQTEANSDFVEDVCYKGAFNLEEAIREERPAGLPELGNWPTIYHGLSQLPGRSKESWFNFDHHYSDQAFPKAIPEVFKYRPSSMLDIGGNTGKWSMLCAQSDPDVRMTIVDLPGQCKLAREKIAEAGLQKRIDTFGQNVLDEDYSLPGNRDAVWMSQFLDCFNPEQIVHILSHVKQALAPDGKVFILDTFWDLQDNRTAAYCLHGTSLYFTTMANGNSKMYDSVRMEEYLNNAGLKVEECIRTVGFYHSLLVCGPTTSN